MVGRRSFRREARSLGAGGALALALMLGASAPALASEEPRLVMVEHSPAMIEALEGKGFDVGFVGEHYEAGVYVDDIGEARLRAEGYKIGETLEDEGSWLARKAQIAETTAAEALSGLVAKNGLSKSAKAKGAVELPGETVIMRSYTFTNYAGRFLYAEAHNKATTAASGPVLSLSYAGPDGVFRARRQPQQQRPDQLSEPEQQQRPSAGRQRLRHRRGGRGSPARAARPSASRATS